ncbi:hypothetical protein CPB84DRAFT_1870347 [Gymnopilus junonius]|uniref:Uncharacterized protein n=1 Tax=Gymnopilus junonius TaxID=109634 RepID=A0A9P5NWY8_GYMJU|nr:hypothetical protein CPB84DRAFT_1870347 [Gymnopilus junonius]
MPLTEPLQPEYVVGGYYLRLEKIHELMAELEIDDRGVDLHFTEYPINKWLAKQGKFHILAGAIAHPATEKKDDVDGILFMTRFYEIHGKILDNNIVPPERDADIAVKSWLIQDGGVQEDDLTWVALFDNFHLTRNGIRPEKNDGPGRHQSVTLTEDQMLKILSDKKTVAEVIAEATRGALGAST